MPEMPSPEEVLAALRGNHKGLTSSQLRGILDVTKKHKMGFRAMLQAMIEDGRISRNRFKEYQLVDRISGRPERESGQDGASAFRDGGRSERKRKRKAELRDQPRIHRGTLLRKEDAWWVREMGGDGLHLVPNGRRIPGVKDGLVVAYELYPHPRHGREFLAKVSSTIGQGSGTFAELSTNFQRESGLPEGFLPDVVREVDAAQAPDAAEIANRRDLRKLKILCIDPVGARDHDDAVSVERLSGGEWELGVHIADVSHYVREGSALDREALRRSYTQYLPWTAVPMLPEELSAGLCSLMEGEDRFAFSCMMRISSRGLVRDYEFVKSVIRVTRGITYEEAMELHGKNDPETLEMAAVAAALRGQRERNGTLELGSPEYKVEFSPDGEPIGITKRSSLPSMSWIEECMLIANQCCARELRKRKLAGVYRIHEAPDAKNILELAYAEPQLFQGSPVKLHDLGAPTKPGSNLDPRAFALYQYLVEKARGDDSRVYRILRSMKKARYSPEPGGHFALNWQDYAHFTSPIRRYADLWCHRELTRGKPSDATASRVDRVCELISENEISNQKCERSAVKLCAAWMLRDRIGEEFGATITGIESFGLFVQIDDPPCDGLVRYRDIPGDYFVYNPDRGVVQGRRSGRSYRRGDRVRVQLLRTDPPRGQVDFAMLGKVERILDRETMELKPLRAFNNEERGDFSEDTNAEAFDGMSDATEFPSIPADIGVPRSRPNRGGRSTGRSGPGRSQDRSPRSRSQNKGHKGGRSRR